MGIRIGISGWRYAPWRGVFYPEGLPQREELAYAARCFGSVEINGSFYSLQTPKSWAAWHDATPENFVFAVKAPRFVTHMRRLRDAEKAVANFFASGVLRLRGKLGPVLWQLPPSLKFDRGLLADFLALLPRDTGEARALAQRRDTAIMRGRTALAIDAVRPLRHAFEVRHASFLDEAFLDLLRDHGAALVVADAAAEWPYAEDVTADFMYLRLHGATELYASGYDAAALADWARRIRAWADGGQVEDARTVRPGAPSPVPRDVYCYFDNDSKVRAPFDARALMDLLRAQARD
ncbi:DUF72 domain-containing protein [Coralloluteibacterium thermophilus]|uniref:DUF72 domain-containing protein n=1 Tax=Coralloluteibacterium thermophilum TaxID=2707049 RepID=A0ABV9NKL4_9GAMM